MPSGPTQTQTPMSRFERMQLGYVLDAQEQRDKLRTKYKLGPSKLGGKLAEVRRRRLDEAGFMDRMGMVARTGKTRLYRTGSACNKG